MAPADSPHSATISAIEVSDPFLARTWSAASAICSRRAARCASLTRGMAKRITVRYCSGGFAFSRSLVSSLPTRLRTVGAGTVVLGLTWALTSCSGSQPAAPAFDTVSLGTVSTGVTASGALAAKTSEQLGFAQGGKLTAVDVKVGQKVQAGDVLATVDSKAARAALKQAEANADAQAAGLGKAADDPSVQGAASTLAQARHVVLESKQQAAATQDADNTAIARSKKQKRTDENAKNDAEDAVDAAKNACDDAQTTSKKAAAAAQASAADPSNPS